MTSQGHKKHADVNKPLGGKIHRNEIAILGAPCGVIQKLCQDIAQRLPHLRVGYLDAAHNNEEPIGEYHVGYIDKIDFHHLKFSSENIEHEFRSIFNSCDLVLVNGNHFTAAKQIPIINQKKKESLQRKMDRLTNVLGFILDEGEHDLHDYLQASFQEVPAIPITELEKVVALVSNEISNPSIRGLVLAGGKSIRMGEDKGIIRYHDLPQREHTAQLLSSFCEDVFLSAPTELESQFRTIKDSFTDLGPFGGIVSAFREDPNAAWLVVATDIPLLDEETMKQLIDNRNPSKVATCFHNPATNFPEPLITLWEPRAYPRLLHFLSLGYSCPRKVLINSEIEEIAMQNLNAMKNANTPEEKAEIMAQINA